MRSWVSFLLCVACISWPAVALRGQQQAEQPSTAIFKSGRDVVGVYVTVIDSQNRLVPDLEEEQFEILDNERPQAVTMFVNEFRPVTAVVLLDTSSSMTGNLGIVRSAAEQFLIRLLPGDRARVGMFNDKIRFRSELSADRDMLVESLETVDFGNGTRLYDAIAAALNGLSGVTGRRVILVLTDGDDTSSHAGLGDVLARARAEDVMIYAIGLQGQAFYGPRRLRTTPGRELKRLADETGGGFFELTQADDLGPTFTRVARELHSQYILGFTPTILDGKLHRLQVKIVKPGVQARARKSYWAPTGTSAPR